VHSKAMVLVSGMEQRAPQLQRTLRTSSLMRMHQATEEQVVNLPIFLAYRPLCSLLLGSPGPTVLSRAMVLVSGMVQRAHPFPTTLPVSFRSQKPKPCPTEEHLLNLPLLNLPLLNLLGSLPPDPMVLSRAMVLVSGMDPQAPPLQRTLRISSLMGMHQVHAERMPWATTAIGQPNLQGQLVQGLCQRYAARQLAVYPKPACCVGPADS